MGKTAFAIRHKLAVERIDFFAGCFFRGFGGSEIDLTRIEGKRKLSQNREPRDFDSTLQALDASGRTDLAEAMRDAKR